MPRKKLVRPLPPLRRNRSLARSEYKIERLSEILRDAAKKHQTEQRQVFYAVRDVAKRFDVSLSLVAAVYRQLEREGLLTRVRGSRTLLEAFGSGRQVVVHAIIGVPMALSSFLTRQKYRMFFMRMRRELRRRGFVTAGLLYEGSEANADFLFERIRQCNVDSVLWYMPDRCARETAFLLRDAGVRVIGIGDGNLPSFACRYEIQREKAIAEILRDWKAGGEIDKVQIVRTRARSAMEEERITELVESEGLAYEFSSATHESYDTFLRGLAVGEGSAVILPALSGSLLAFRSPDALIHLMNQRRVALVDGPVSLPFADVPLVKVDLAVADWQRVTSSITTDLLAKEAPDPSGPTVFQAEAKLRVPLSDFAQCI